MDENTKLVLIAFINALVAIAAYYFGRRSTNSNSDEDKLN